MATLHQLQAALQGAVSGALASLIPPPMVGIGWPSESTLMNNIRSPSSGVVTIYDRKISKDSTRWKPTVIGTVVTPATLQTVVTASEGAPQPVQLLAQVGDPLGGLVGDPSGGVLTSVDAQATITLSGTPTAGDAVSCIIIPWPQSTTPQAVVVNAGVNAPTTATALAAAINAQLSALASAAVSGAIVTVTGLVSCIVQSYAGNGGTQTLEIARRLRQMQIVVWTRTEALRQVVGDPIESLIASMQYQNGVAFTDGTTGRVLAGTDYYLEDATLYDTYRRDFLFSVDYPITTQNALYAVLAPVLEMEIS